MADSEGCVDETHRDDPQVYPGGERLEDLNNGNWFCGRCGALRTGGPRVKIDGEPFDPGCVPDGHPQKTRSVDAGTGQEGSV